MQHINLFNAVQGMVIDFHNDHIFDDTLIKQKQKSFYIENHEDFLKATKYVLQSATQLLEASSGKLVYPGEDKKYRMIKMGETNMVGVDKYLIRQCIKTKDIIVVQDNETIYDTTDLVIGKSQKSMILAPLMISKDIVFGALLIENKMTAQNFTAEDINLIRAFCNTFARLLYSACIDKTNSQLMVHFTSNLYSLLENLYLFKNNLDNNLLLSEMIKVSRLINSTLDINNLLESIMDSAKLVLKTEGASLMLIDKRTNELYFNVIAGEKEKALKEMRIPMGKGIAGITAQTKEPMIVNNAQDDDRVFKEADEKINFVTRNMLACPLLVRNKVIGVIEVINTIGRDDFTEKDLDLFMSFSEQAALAIHNRELIDNLQNINRELKKKVHELSSLHEIGKALISNLNEKDLFDSIVKIIADELQSERVSILLFNDKTNTFEVLSHFGLAIDVLNQPEIHLDKTLAGQALKENKVIFTNNLADTKYSHYANEDRYSTGSCIIQPLVSGNQRFGTLNIADKIDQIGYNEDDYRLISTVTSQLIKGIENFRLLQEKIEKRAYEKELEITSSIQKSILPSKKIDNPYFETGIVSQSAKIMGGDFYDYFAYPNDQFSFSIADVSGKSLPAALFMAVTSSIIRTIGRYSVQPAEVLHQSNDLIYRASQSGMFVTLFYCNYDAINRELKYASAGHNEQLIYRHDTKEFEYLRAKGSPLGVMPNTGQNPFGQGTSYLRQGDLLVLYTDGVVEAINTRKEEYGLQRFENVIRENYLLNSDQMVKKIFRDVCEFAGEEPQFDDFTLVIVKVNK